MVTISEARPWSFAARADRAADQAEADQRDAPGSAAGRSFAGHEVAQAVDDEAIGLFGADGHAQRMMQTVFFSRAARGPAW